ncbi:MAG TPA: sigma-54 dependent transcriptional regulator [Blastocatellia bacterium]
MAEVSKHQKLLMLDDDQFFCDVVRDGIGGEALSVVTAHTIAAARALCGIYKFDVVLLDNGLPDGSGLDLIPDVLRTNEHAKIILITAFPNWSNAVTALKNGAYDYLSKPIELEELRVTVDRALRSTQLEHIEQVHNYKSNRESAEAALIGEGPEFLEVRELIRKAAATRAPVMITGETGTGKNVIAKAIHYAGSSGSQPFISVNCAALPESLVESELFGVEKGAFTGAHATRKGTVELADGGALFLDEIGEMPVALQAKLLSVLEDQKVKRVGGDIVRSVDVRVITATNLDVERAIREGRFRSDLYYRLGVIHIHLRPLKERPQDIPQLSRFFARKFAPGRNIDIPDSEIDALMRYHWPGNVRELKNVIERSLILQEGSTLRSSTLLSTPAFRSAESAPSATQPNDPLSLDEVERRHILNTLEQFFNNYTRTAIALGVSLSTLKRKLKEYQYR